MIPTNIRASTVFTLTLLSAPRPPLVHPVAAYAAWNDEAAGIGGILPPNTATTTDVETPKLIDYRGYLGFWQRHHGFVFMDEDFDMSPPRVGLYGRYLTYDVFMDPAGINTSYVSMGTAELVVDRDRVMWSGDEGGKENVEGGGGGWRVCGRGRVEKCLGRGRAVEGGGVSGEVACLGRWRVWGGGQRNKRVWGRGGGQRKLSTDMSGKTETQDF